MQGQGAHQARRHSKNPRQNGESGPMIPGETRELPRWESFPAEDRHRLVHTLLQAARRQVETRPANGQPRR
jgi:hypothetical protein